MVQRGLKINMKKTKSMVTGNKLERGFSQEDGHVDAVEEGWKQTLCNCVCCSSGSI